MRRLYALLGVATALAFASCNQELEEYSTEECHLNFLFYDKYDPDDLYNSEEIEKNLGDAYNVKNFSFAYAGEAQRDTMWFKVGTMGFLSDHDRPIALEQIQVPDTVENAKPGVHYVAFDDPSLAGFYKVPAGQDTVSIPVVLLRDPSLDTKSVVLGFTFKDNDYFSAGYESMSTRVIFFTAKPERPNGWKEQLFGEWGPVKHNLFMEWTGKPWDEEYIIGLWDDYPYVEYMNVWLHNKLEEENAKRLADPEIGDVYREPTLDNKPLEIPLFKS